jgi:hypothetical protein
MATNEDVIERLDKIAAILKLAHRDAIESARKTIRADKVNAAILDGSKKWTPSGKLKTAVSKKAGTSGTTYADRIAELLELGVLEKQGGGPTTQYKTTGLI